MAARRRCLYRLIPREYRSLSFAAPHVQLILGFLRPNASSGRTYSTASSQRPPSYERRVAVLYQAIEPAVINGVRKPKKPGGYRDSGSDIAYNLSSCTDARVVCPVPNPKPESDSDWCFPDTEDGILEALEKGVTHLWANTILFASHPLQTSSQIGKFEDRVRVVGHGPLIVEKYDDKELVNNMLRKAGRFTMPRSWSLHETPTLVDDIRSQDVQFPVVAKPIRGRGSHGVRVCHTLDELVSHARSLFQESPAIMLEEFLAGEEATVTVMPPTVGKSQYWSLPIVTRFNHVEGIAPYNGVVAVTANSRVISKVEESNPTYAEVARECEQAAELLGVTAPIRIDVRRFKDSPDSKFALFDLNMKPNMTGPGRPGRDDQASLTLLAAIALGWDYQELLKQILGTASTLGTLRSLKPLERLQ